MSKPYHLMTAAERTATRIAQNRAIAEKIEDNKVRRPPARSTEDFTRASPEDRAKLGTVIRKIDQ